MKSFRSCLGIAAALIVSVTFLSFPAVASLIHDPSPAIMKFTSVDEAVFVDVADHAVAVPSAVDSVTSLQSSGRSTATAVGLTFAHLVGLGSTVETFQRE